MTELEQADSVFQNYKCYCLNRLKRRGGGAAVFILTNKKSEHMSELTVNSPHVEAVFVKVTLPNILLIVSSIYRPPNSNLHDFRAYIENNISSINWCETDLSTCEDFNLDLLKKMKTQMMHVHSTTIWILWHKYLLFVSRHVWPTHHAHLLTIYSFLIYTTSVQEN